MGIPQKVENLRRQYLEKRAHIATETKLCEAIQEEMQACCPHPVVVHFNGWCDRGGEISASRICWACGFYEQGEYRGGMHHRDRQQEAWQFKILTGEPIASASVYAGYTNKIMATPVKDLPEELKKIEKEYLERYPRP